MKRFTPTPTLVTGALAVLALTILAATPSWGAGATTQSSDLLTFAGFQDVGDAWLLRTGHGVSARAAAEDLEPGVYTVWWVVWNNPEACGADGCTDADFGAPDVDVDIGYAAGRVVGGDGPTTFAAHLSEGEDLAGFPTEFGIASGSGLLDAGSAEIHLVIRSHGEKIPGLVAGMVHTFNAGCRYDVFPVAVPPLYGTPGPNLCEDVIFTVFE